MEMINGGGGNVTAGVLSAFLGFKTRIARKWLHWRPPLRRFIPPLWSTTISTSRQPTAIRWRFKNNSARTRQFMLATIFVVCFKLLAHYASSLRSIQQDSGSMEKILKANWIRWPHAIKPKSPLMTISSRFRKTGQLFALSCFIGAYESGGTTNFAKRPKNRHEHWHRLPIARRHSRLH